MEEQRAVLVDHYAVLGLQSPGGAKLSEKEIRKACRQKALQLHPDKRADHSSDDFQKLQHSYQVLINPITRHSFHQQMFHQQQYNQYFEIRREKDQAYASYYKEQEHEDSSDDDHKQQEDSSDDDDQKQQQEDSSDDDDDDQEHQDSGNYRKEQREIEVEHGHGHNHNLSKQRQQPEIVLEIIILTTLLLVIRNKKKGSTMCTFTAAIIISFGRGTTIAHTFNKIHITFMVNKFLDVINSCLTIGAHTPTTLQYDSSLIIATRLKDHGMETTYIIHKKNVFFKRKRLKLFV